MREGWNITVGDMRFHLQRDGDDVVITSGFIRQRLSRAEVEELRDNLEEVMAEMFGEDA